MRLSHTHTQKNTGLLFPAKHLSPSPLVGLDPASSGSLPKLRPKSYIPQIRNSGQSENSSQDKPQRTHHPWVGTTAQDEGQRNGTLVSVFPSGPGEPQSFSPLAETPELKWK